MTADDWVKLLASVAALVGAVAGGYRIYVNGEKARRESAGPVEGYARLTADMDRQIAALDLRRKADRAEFEADLAEMRDTYGRQLDDIRVELTTVRLRAARAERRVSTLTDLIRTHAPNIQIPPEETS